MKIIVLSKELIAPSSPTPFELKTYKLSFIDQQIPPYYTSSIHYYLHNESSNITQSKMTIKLKTSLSKTLTRFYPLAGRLSKNRNTIDCNDQGVQFLVARVGSKNLLDVVKNPIVEELNELVMVESSYVEEQLAIQVNLFDCGGIAVGISVSHRIMDACSLSWFVSHWFSTTKGPETPLIGPVLDSAVLFPPMESHEYRRNPKNPTVHVPSKDLVTKRFVFSSLAINKLKHGMVKNGHNLVNPTRVEVVTALIWKCATAALGDYKASVAFHVVNFRKRMEPSLQDQQFGNLFQMACAVTHDQTAGMANLVGKLRDSFKIIDNKYLKSLTGKNGAEIAIGNFKQIGKFMIQEDVGVFRFSSWCRFAVNESDFGWGKPVWVSMANLGDENSVIFTDSAWNDGIEAWIVMNDINMQKFEQSAELQAFVGLTRYPTRATHPSCHL